MSHKITPRDVVLLAEIPELFDGFGWHRMGTPTKIFTAETCKRALFGHEMRPAGIMLTNGTFHETGERYAVAMDDGLPLGNAVGKNWASPTNLAWYELFSDAIAGSPFKIVSALTVDNRTEFSIDAKCDPIQAGTRSTVPFVNFQRQYGGKGLSLIGPHNLVVQCGNTTRLARAEMLANEDSISAKNCGNIFAKLPAMKKAIENSWGVAAQFARAMAESENIPVKIETASRAFVGFLTDGKPLSTRSVNRANRLVSLFKTGAGNRGENLADWFNAATDFFTHESAGSIDSADSVEDFQVKQWYSSEFGSARNTKADLVSAVFDLKLAAPRKGFISEMSKAGRASIDASEAEIVSELALA